MTLKEKKLWIKKLKPFWKARDRHYINFIAIEHAIEFDMKNALGEDLEFFYVDGECVGIGHTDYSRRKRHNKNYFPLIQNSDLYGR
jgi:hypothetical protein